ncbi:MAG TPA: hypothetical protein VHT96_12080 [Clostridia bacterium]|nr:hypothetical protein [Clostridia bacterium]
MELEQLRLDCAVKQKKGLHFIIASVFIWIAIAVVHFTELPILAKDLLTFCFSAPLMPIAFAVSKIIGVDFSNKGNPLTKLGILFSVNQIVYLLIVMWVYPTVPDKMVMVLAIVFGAHLMPFGWLYKSRSYMTLSIIIPIAALIVGINFNAFIVSAMMVLFEIAFCLLLFTEIRKLPDVKLSSNAPDQAL